MMLGRAVNQNPLGRKPFVQRGLELELADHFDPAALRLPPLEQRAQGLGLAREPGPNGLPLEGRFQLPQGLLDRDERKQVERRPDPAHQRPR